MKAQNDKMISIRVTSEEYQRLEELAELMCTSKIGVIRYFLNQAVVTREAVPKTPAVVELGGGISTRLVGNEDAVQLEDRVTQLEKDLKSLTFMIANMRISEG